MVRLRIRPRTDAAGRRHAASRSSAPPVRYAASQAQGGQQIPGQPRTLRATQQIPGQPQDAASYAADTRAAARRGELRSVSGTRRAAGQASRVADAAHIGAHAPRKIHRRCIFYSRAHASTHTRTSAHAPRKKYQRYFFYSRVRVTHAPARSRVRRYCARVRATNGRGEPKSCLVFVRIFMTSFRADAPVKVQYYCSNFCTI